MKESKPRTAETRRWIVRAAAELRRKGSAMGLCELTAAAGLTHGGFYGHFSSNNHCSQKARPHKSARLGFNARA